MLFVIVIFSLFFTYKKISDFFKKKLYSYNFGLFVWEYITIYFCYPDPDQSFLEWIRIRPNGTDPT